MPFTRVLGLILIAFGIFALVAGGVFWTERDTVADVGPVQITRDDREGFALPPVVGIIALVGGIALVAIPDRRRV